jgi:regulatory protein YycI of two-component signal transduction system YycFG
MIPEINVTETNLEEFVLKHAGNLVIQASQTVEMMKDYISSAPNADDVSAFADLVNANTSALEVMGKVLTQNKKNTNAVKIKQMDIDNKKENLNTTIGASLLLTREELMDQLLKGAGAELVKTIEVQVEDVET